MFGGVDDHAGSIVTRTTLGGTAVSQASVTVTTFVFDHLMGREEIEQALAEVVDVTPAPIGVAGGNYSKSERRCKAPPGNPALMRRSTNPRGSL